MIDSRGAKECLDKLLSQNDTVFIVPHKRPDMDAVGSAIGMALICKKNKKRYYIVIDDDIDKIESASRAVIKNINGEFVIIKAANIKDLITDNSLMIAVDVNKTDMISTEPYLGQFKDIFVLDHHRTDEKTIKTDNLFVDENLSSTCEEVSRLLFLNKIKLESDHANYLLAGIYLDTNKMTRNVGDGTYYIAYQLSLRGADASVANNMFLEDYEHDRAIQRLVDNTIFPAYRFAIASDKDGSGKIYEVEDIAKASEYLLNYQVNATFAIAFIDEETISISARSKGIIDVAKLMKIAFGGGGKEHAARAVVKGMTIEQVRDRLNQVLMPTAFIDNAEMSNGDEMSLKMTKNVENNQ